MKRAERLAVDKFTCFTPGCGRTSELEVHHLSYKNLGHEPIEELRTLCPRCHNDAHYFSSQELSDKVWLQQKPVTESEYFDRKRKCFPVLQGAKP